MAVFKCKMCGGTIEFNAGDTVGICDSCGTKQTLPKADSEALTNLFNRANTLRLKSEFDKASDLYSKIIENDPSQAEAYWGLILCKFGIEYVEDPQTFARIPTCHRASFDAITADEDYKLALQYADMAQKALYEQEAKTIDGIQQGILAISQKEEPYDVFICYKETDADGHRTQDSVLANDIYHQLTAEGMKVFYAAITLEDKLGQEYEPYIFAALNSAKVMLVIGSKPEYFEAVWVKNEWSRFLKLMKNDRTKLLIPCYRDMDAYELPEEFAHLQAQDMTKIGFINDILRGIRKVVNKQEPAPVKTVPTAAPADAAPSANVSALMDRGFMALEDGEWKKADDFFEQVLNTDARSARAYLGKLMAEQRVKTQEALRNCEKPFDGSGNYQKVLRFDAKLGETLKGYISYINERNENARLNGIYNKAVSVMQSADSEETYKEAADLFGSIPAFKDAAALKKQCLEKAEVCRKDAIYASAMEAAEEDDDREEAILLFQSISGWKYADEKIGLCRQMIAEKEAKQEAARVAAEKAAIKRKKDIRNYILGGAVLLAVVLIIGLVIIPSVNYKKARSLSDEGNYREAALAFGKLDDYRDAKEQALACWDTIGVNTVVAGPWHTVGLREDGTVVAVGHNESGRCGVSDWSDIVAVAAGDYHTVGLRADGTVVAVGYNGSGRCDVSGWHDIVSVAAGVSHTVGLHADGTVVAVGNKDLGRCTVSDWHDIVSVAAGYRHTVGLREDGTVVAVGDNDFGQCDVSGWHDIAAIAAGDDHTVGLRNDGTVVAVGSNWDGQCGVSGWSDIRVPKKAVG